MSVLKVKPTLNGGGEGGAMYKHTVTLHCLNNCSSDNDIIVIFNSSKKEECTEDEFKGLFTIYYQGGDCYFLNIVNVVIDVNFNTQGGQDNILYYKNEDKFKVRGESYTLQSFEDTVTAI